MFHDARTIGGDKGRTVEEELRFGWWFRDSFADIEVFA
jgi:hypothetical protein